MRRIASAAVLIWVWCAACLPLGAVSLEEEVRLGTRVMAEVRPFELTADPALTAIGERLAAVVERQEVPWRFWVVEDLNKYNAFAAPGGFVFITRSYLKELSEDEAAFVLAHEMAHVDLHHYKRESKRQQRASLGNLLLRVLSDGTRVWGTVADLGATAYMTHYSRALEKEADLIGYQYAEKGGYDARLAVTALSKLGEQPKLHPWIVNLYSTHPLLSSREDRLAAIGGEEPEQIEIPEADPRHSRDLTAGLTPLDPTVPIAVRILAPEDGRWENQWRKNFTKRLHLRLVPLGFTIAGDDVMYKRDIGDPAATAASKGARYLLLVTVHAMESVPTGAAELTGTPVRARVEVSAQQLDLESGSTALELCLTEEGEGRDVLPVDPEILYRDTVLGGIVERIAGDIAIGCAKVASASR